MSSGVTPTTKPYTIWGCCGTMEHEDSLEDALSYAYGLENGDYHTWLSIECPDGTVITDTSLVYRDYEADRRAKDEERRKAANNTQQYARVEVQGPNGGWRRETCRRADLDELVEKYRAWYGDARVRVP